MYNIEWKKSFEIGNKHIDAEHIIFLSLIKTYSISEAQQVPKEQLFRMLSEIGAYAVFHFISEENLMINSRYPEYEHHKSLHEALLVDFADIKIRFVNDQTGRGEVVDFLYHWFVHHTAIEDSLIAKHLAASAK